MSIKRLKYGFTMVELLVVIGIISILIGLVVVIAGKAMLQSRNAQDLANLKLLGNATWSFAADHKGKLLSSRDRGGATDEQEDRLWIRAYGTDSDNHPRMLQDNGPQGQEVELLSTLIDGEAYPYIGDIRPYSSPFDPTIAGSLDEYTGENWEAGALVDKYERIRSYAFNAAVGCEWGADDHWGFHDGAQNWPIDPNCEWEPTSVPPLYGKTPHDCGYFLPTETISQIPQPGGTMVAIGEWDAWGANLGGFTIHPTDYTKWIDFPAMWNNGLVNMSYVDGSTGAIQFESKGLIDKWVSLSQQTGGGHDFNYYDPSGNYADYFKLRSVMLPGRIGGILDEGIEDIQLPD